MLEMGLGTVVCLLFTFHMRVLDEHKDREFDDTYHAHRPVQRGLITLGELRALNAIGLALQGILSLALSPKASLWWLLAVGYSFVAGREFFLGAWIRSRFFLCNFLNLLQLMILQVYIYALIRPDFSWNDALLAVHFAFMIANAGVLEVARKLKRRSEETEGRDTYSARLGIPGASVLYLSLCAFVYALFSVMRVSLPEAPAVLYASTAPFALVILVTLTYACRDWKGIGSAVQATAVLFYLSMHALLAFTGS